MPRYRVTTAETTTYAYWVDAENEDEALNNFAGDAGKEINHEVEFVSIEKVED